MAAGRLTTVRDLGTRVDTPVSGIAWIGSGARVERPTSVREPPTLVAAIAPPAKEPRSVSVEVLRADDVIRLRHFARWVIVLCSVALFVSYVHGGSEVLRTITRCALVLMGGTAAFVSWSARHTTDYEALRPKMRFFGVVAALTSLVFELRIGMFSPVHAVIVFGMAYFARSEARRLVWALGSFVVAAYATTAMLMALDVLADPGVFNSAGLSRPVKCVAVLSTTLVYVATLLQARTSRRSAEAMLLIARNATLEAHRREAQLAEANVDLARMLRANIGREGRYSGTTTSHWSIGDVVGRGAMGEVYAAVDRRTGERVAVKFLHPATSAMDEDPRPRFVREARIAASLRSSNLVTVHGIGETVDGAPFIAMELLEGRDLACRLRRESRLPLSEVVTMVRQVTKGLAIAHEAGVVHRDLKPQNLFYANHHGTLRWKVLDFGISTLVDSNGTLTAEAIIGTPGYMSPEQANGQRVDARTDLFALGVVIYRALTGHPAFPGSAAPQILYSVVFENAIRPRALDPSLPPDIEAFLAIALAKDPKDRFTCAAEMADAFERAAANRLPPDLRVRADQVLLRTPWKSLPTGPSR
jgi:tRNA A-37 threonylcarbamoyl transferase component Bud32